jgi:TPR repeat protein
MKTHTSTSMPLSRCAGRLAVAMLALLGGTSALALPQPAREPAMTGAPPPAPQAEPQQCEPSLERLRFDAGRGNVAAMVLLGDRYAKGEGVPQDQAEATAWFRRAAEAGSPEGMVLFGWSLAFGRGVPQDEPRAVDWFRRAAGLGSALGMTSLGWAYEEGSGVEADPAQALHWYRRAADAGNNIARRALQRLEAER